MLQQPPVGSAVVVVVVVVVVVLVVVVVGAIVVPVGHGFGEQLVPIPPHTNPAEAEQLFSHATKQVPPGGKQHAPWQAVQSVPEPIHTPP